MNDMSSQTGCPLCVSSWANIMRTLQSLDFSVILNFINHRATLLLFKKMLQSYSTMYLTHITHLLIFYVILLKPLIIHGHNSSLLNPLQIRPILSISDRVLPIQLVDTVDSSVNAPRRKQLRVKLLMKTIGEDFDSSWMSIEKPKHLTEEDLNETISQELIDEVKNLNLSHVIASTNSDIQELDKLVIEKFERWLLIKASCPVRYIWEDVGPLFWPRWMKRGECINSNEREACSWPSGMHCVPSESITVHLLRWHCRPKSTSSIVNIRPKLRHQSAVHRLNRKNLLCKWLKVPYPVTSQCNCSC
ncbi:hypothetical protein CHUAL_013795 [Chamberlinius hualienensis]